MTDRDTIAAIATAPGKAGVAVVRISGMDAFAIAATLIGSPVEPGAIRYRRVINPVDGKVLDDVVVLVFKGPHSYTGEDVVELQGHGGAVTPRRILDATFAAGARLARRGEFTERAFLNGKLDYDQAEAVLDLINARTDCAADAALAGLAGCRQRELRELYETAMTISTKLEHALDVDTDELPVDFSSRVNGEISALAHRIAAEMERLRRGRIMRDGALVVIAGEPNAGKSSLMNALLNERRAIVSDIPGTTRDSIEAWMDLDGFPVRLVDTAGLRQSADVIEAEGVRRAQELIDAADVVINLSPIEDAAILNRKLIAVRSKCDLWRERERSGALPVSAVTGEGLAELKAELSRRLAKVEPRDEIRGLDVLQLAYQTLTAVNADDLVLMANAVRSVASGIGEQIGATYSADLLDRLFSRFCVGK